MNEFTPDSMFSYNRKKKVLFAINLLITVIIIFLFIFLYITFLSKSDFIVFKGISGFINHIVGQIKVFSTLGVLYAASFGGLFFVVMSMEALYIGFLKSGTNPFLTFLFYIIGHTIAYSINYYIGGRFQEISKKLISLKKFYKIKGLINRYGPIVIFVFNVLPLPSQPLSAMLGVFRYNKTRFYIFFISGQTIKYGLIAFAYVLLFKGA
jgi:membrane protein YqaA with SNARE-associated domain